MEQLETGKNKKQGKKEHSVLALSPREVLEVYSRIWCGAFSGHSHDENPGCAMTVATMATFRDSKLTDKTEDLGVFALFRSRTCVWCYSPTTSSTQGLIMCLSGSRIFLFFSSVAHPFDQFLFISLGVREAWQFEKRKFFFFINSVTHNCKIFCLEIS